jgi:ribonuclease Z
MRHFSLTILILTSILACFGQVKTNKDSLQENVSTDLIVTLLGTGMPQPVMERFGPSILVQAGSETLLVDAGRGCLQRLRQLNMSYDKIDALFLTHLHSDHIVGLPDLWLTGWLVSERSIPLNVYGPIGTTHMIEYLQKAFAFDIKIRVADDKKLVQGSRFLTKEIKQGLIYEKNGVRVIAIKVDHHYDIPAFGYRIEYNKHSVVLSGDTRYSENLISFAKSTDLLVHEVVIAPDTVSKTDPKYPVFAHHTTIEQAAKVFNEVKPKLAVYSHIVKPFGGNEQELVRRTKAKYSGPVIIGEDLMSFFIGASVSSKTWRNN